MAIMNPHALWPTLEVSTSPAIEPVCLEDIKAFLQYDDDDQDSLIESLAITAREELERVTQRAFIQQTVKLYADDFPPSFELRKCPVSSISSITYTDTDDATQTVSSANYQLDAKSEPAVVWPVYGVVWPTDVKLDTLNAVTVTFVAGYGTSQDDVPERVKTAIKMATKAAFYGCEPGMGYAALVDSLSWGRLWG